MNPKHEPTEKTRSEVIALKSFGHTHSEIATYLDICSDTMELHYRRELDTACTRANSAVANKLYRKATEQEDLGAMIFWLKTRARWKTAPDEDKKDTLIETLVNVIKNADNKAK